jgi:serine protease Do
MNEHDEINGRTEGESAQGGYYSFNPEEKELSDSIGEHVERQLREGGSAYSDGSYSDADYILSDEAPTTPRRYYTPPEREPRQTEPRQRKQKGVFSRVLAGVLAGVLMGSAVSVGVMGMLQNRSTAGAELSANLSGIVTETPEPTPTPLLTVNTTHGDEMTATDIYAAATAQVVGIRTEITGYNIWGQATTNAVSGTGFIISEDGYILTNHHVIEDAYKGGYDVNVIFYNGDTYVAEIVGFEGEDSDVAVLKIDKTGLTPVTFGDSSTMAVGETVYAVGNPLGELTYTMTRGMVSALDREISTRTTVGNTYVTTTMNMFQFDAAVNSGNSGGPVYNSRGEVVGMVSAKYAASGVEGLGFALPINDVIDIANDLITKGYVSGKPTMGIQAQNMPQNVASYYGVPTGSYVYMIDEGSAAERAGLQKGDIITAIDGRTVSGNSDLIAAEKNYKAGDTATLTVYRDGSSIQVEITFDEQKPDEDVAIQQTDAQQGTSRYFPGYGGTY